MNLKYYVTLNASDWEEKHCIISLICDIKMQIQQNRSRLIDTENRHVVANGVEDWGGRDWELWISRWQIIIYTMGKQGPTI